jgi:serine/threonine-protein kinase HipA
MDDGLLPRNLAQGKIAEQFMLLAEHAGLGEKQVKDTFQLLLSGSDKVQALVAASFLDESTKRNYWQAYQTILKKLMK